jgi:crossover junction endodeoxyribonuclease RuvC
LGCLLDVQGCAVITLGIDVGVTGAIAILEDGELVDALDMPVLADGPAKRRTVNAPLLAEIVFKSHAELAYVEHVGVRPKEGAVGAFAFGRCRGVIEGVLAAAGLPVAFLTPPTWKRLTNIPPGRDGAKDAARSEAIRRWPAKAGLFARVKDDGRAEAALIGAAHQARTQQQGD